MHRSRVDNYFYYRVDQQPKVSAKRDEDGAFVIVLRYFRLPNAHCRLDTVLDVYGDGSLMVPVPTEAAEVQQRALDGKPEGSAAVAPKTLQLNVDDPYHQPY